MAGGQRQRGGLAGTAVARGGCCFGSQQVAAHGFEVAGGSGEGVGVVCGEGTAVAGEAVEERAVSGRRNLLEFVLTD